MYQAKCSDLYTRCVGKQHKRRRRSKGGHNRSQTAQGEGISAFWPQKRQTKGRADIEPSRASAVREGPPVRRRARPAPPRADGGRERPSRVRALTVPGGRSGCSVPGYGAVAGAAELLPPPHVPFLRPGALCRLRAGAEGAAGWAGRGGTGRTPHTPIPMAVLPLASRGVPGPAGWGWGPEGSRPPAFPMAVPMGF